MGPGLRAEKELVRQEVRKRLDKLSEQARNQASTRACQLLASQAQWQQARSVLMYAPMGGELDVWPLLEMALGLGKVVALPRYDALTNAYGAFQLKDLANDLEPGRYGIREPKGQSTLLPLNRLDFILVPGLAYDLQGHRLGRGRGFYDRLLGAVCGTTCGVAFEEQIVRRVPVEPHDSDVNCILTPTRWIEL